jgi:hypothetical protein
MATDSKLRRAPGWLKYANKLVKAMIRRGFAPGPHHILSVPGRRSGVLRGTPVAIISAAGKRYVVGGFTGADWVRNAEAAGWGMLRRGRRENRVTLTELPASERPPVLRQFAKEVRGGRGFLAVASDGTDKEFAAAALQHPVFRIDDESAPEGR